MKNYKKAVLTTMVLAAMPLLAATSNTPIKVTTFDDEDDGAHPNKTCSLREALITAETRKSYGGCEVTDIISSNQKVIQLEAGTYTLQKELTPNVDVLILGASPIDWQDKKVLVNDIVNQYPAETTLKTTIKAENSRIFNTTVGSQALALNNLILKGGRTNDRGGAIYAGADITLQNTQILDSQADKDGGAIYLAGPSASLTLSKTLIQGNHAPIGSVLSMSCLNDTIYSKRTINISGSSIIKNGDLNSNSMFELCGEPKVNLENNTIAQNLVKASSGNLIKFTGDAIVGDETSNPSSILSSSSSLILKNNTIVENQGYTTLLYDKIGTKELSYNIIAYNGNSNSYACRYLLGDVKDQKDFKFNSVSYNAFALTGNNQCILPDESLKNNETNIDISNTNILSLLSPLQEASAYTAFLPLYYPKDNNIKTDLVDTGATDCSTTDQRNLSRNTTQILHYNPEKSNTCDIGSVELMKLTAGDIKDLSNTSISEMVTNYQNQYDFFNDLVNNPNDAEFLTYYKTRQGQYKNLLDSTKKNLKYRGIYLDLNSNKFPLPEDIEQSDGSHKLQFFNPDNYDIKVESLGVGQLETIRPDDNLVCEWNPSLQQILIYRKDDIVTQLGDNVFCKYTIQSKIDNNINSSGLLQAIFINMPPVAKNTSVTLKYKEKQKVSLNLLNFANDDGDTGEGGAGPETNPNKPHFWRNEEGIELPIHLTDVPEKDLHITADRQGPCPEPDQKEICYGGNIYIQEVNAFNPFNFSFKYQVYDADGAASNSATVSVISTATTTDDTRPASSGGGSSGIFSIFGLLSLLAYRRFRK
ncbi:MULTISPECIES: CSLREA domain-containing protein [unclassified Acinetobacter]|uniref:CSLREA domain-containing protein n=1 Tax=unclassified Acinetobacter TaxID=196816 RepID=UPI002449940F|nr:MULTISPECIES: CSLREA domain-containing protein [unclassified Acinetobacter]MDH0031248.1 CSLREA domain-containing protein [Acinetobacter sp. GD04021]MDH0886993.1 CSLREA domain-containing protein [Acinetobacter sp. GD03873]MDH1083444.1 CSLREA domain-containing protein [Acinetobacter sp. GD03983]MDH2190309.1 CSLREA domain-containing protein [Acinetobacter sp. GD03645]MDH2203748.1 CSLREA domain-containing protein [Acinetobacter sp. GD03647]